MENVFTTLGTIKILEIKDNPDGTANIEFDISDEFKKMLLKNSVGANGQTKNFKSLF